MQPIRKFEGNQARQGDVLLVKLEAKPAGESRKIARDEQGRVVLAHGEATGHAHAINDPGAFLYQFGDQIVLEMKQGGTLRHEEHENIELDAGYYEVIRQREHTGEQEWAYVED